MFQSESPLWIIENEEPEEAPSRFSDLLSLSGYMLIMFPFFYH